MNIAHLVDFTQPRTGALQDRNCLRFLKAMVFFEFVEQLSACGILH